MSLDRRWARPLGGIIVTALLLFLIFRQVDLTAVYSAFRAARVEILVPIFLLYFVVRYLLALQMTYGLNLFDFHFNTLDLFRFNLIAGFYTLVLPGELVGGGSTWYKLSRPSGKGVEAAALVLYFRLLNTLTLLGIGLTALWFDPRFAGWQFSLLTGTALGANLLLMLPFLSARTMFWLMRAVPVLCRWLRLPAVLKQKILAASEVIMAFQRLGRPRTLAALMGLSLLAQGIQLFNFYLFALASNIQLPLVVLGWVRSAVAVVQLLSFTFAGLGTREISVVVLLGDYGVPEAQALSLSLLMFSMVVVTGLIGGLVELWDVLAHPRHSATLTDNHNQVGGDLYG